MVDEASSDDKLKVTLTANRTIKTISIDDALLQDKEMLEDYLILTLNKAIEKATHVNETEFSCWLQKMVCLIFLEWICLSNC